MNHVGPISGIAAHPQGLVATAGYDNKVILWDAAKKSALQCGVHDHLANQCAFSADGRFLVSASSDYSARLWDVPSLRLRTVLTGHDDDVEMAAFHPSAEVIATCSRDRTISLHRYNGERLHVLNGHTADVISVAWLEDGETLLSSSDDGTIRRWDARAGRLIETLDLEGVETDTIVIGSDGTIFAGNDNGEIVVIRGRNVQRTAAHQAGIKRLIHDPRQGRLCSLSYDRQLMIWSTDGAAGLSRLASANIPPIVWPRAGAFLDDRAIVLGTFGSTFAHYDCDRDTWNLDGVEPDISINAICLHRGAQYRVGDAGRIYRDGTRIMDVGSLCNFLLPFDGLLLTGGQMGVVFDGLTGTPLYQHRSPLNCGATFRRDGRLFAIIGTYTGEGLVFAADDEGAAAPLRLVSTIWLGDNAIKGLAASDSLIFAVSADCGASLHRIADFAPVHRIDHAHERIANGCTSLPDGRFASISRDRKLRVWRDGRAEVFASPHKNSIKCIASSKDGTWIATASYGGSIALFDSGRQRWDKVVRPTTAGISCLVPCEASGRFLASSYDGSVYQVGIDR